MTAQLDLFAIQAPPVPLVDPLDALTDDELRAKILAAIEPDNIDAKRARNLCAAGLRRLAAALYSAGHGIAEETCRIAALLLERGEAPRAIALLRNETRWACHFSRHARTWDRDRAADTLLVASALRAGTQWVIGQLGSQARLPRPSFEAASPGEWDIEPDKRAHYRRPCLNPHWPTLPGGCYVSIGSHWKLYWQIELHVSLPTMGRGYVSRTGHRQAWEDAILLAREWAALGDSILDACVGMQTEAA